MTFHALLLAIIVMSDIVSCVSSPAASADSMMVIDTQLERFRIRDICDPNNRNLRLYLDYGDTGWIGGYARKPKLDYVVNDVAAKSMSRPTYWQAKTASAPKHCTLELVTCPSCRIKVMTSFMHIVDRTNCTSLQRQNNTVTTNRTRHDDDNDAAASDRGGGDDDELCKCNYISIVEPPFETSAGLRSDKRFCSVGHEMPADYIGYGRSLMIHLRLAHSGPNEGFNLTIVSERNVDETYGTAADPGHIRSIIGDRVGNLRPESGPNAAVIVSPLFPDASPRDLIKQHLITCTSKAPTTLSSSANQTTSACSIRILFTDFQIDLMSRMEIFNSDGDLTAMFTGLVFRPPVIVCDGPSLLLRFYANGGSELRYRAEVDFLPDAGQLAVQLSTVQDMVRPRTECGGSVDTLGGAITMMNMVASNESHSVRYDCVWLLRPSSRYVNTKPLLSLRVDTFEGLEDNSVLSIHEGLTSVQPLLASLRSTTEAGKPKEPGIREYIVSTKTGTYIRLKGTFGALAKLALVYTVFSYESQKAAVEFDCANQKRIPLQLQCDGFDHCGDGSDEPDSCKLAWKHETFDRRWHSNTPNYYFPKTDHYPDMRAATIVFFVSAAGLVVLISGIVLLLYRMGHWARDHRDPQSRHLNTISELLDSHHTDAEEESISEELDPPAYEEPPGYDEVIKVGMDELYAKAKRRLASHSENRQRRRSRRCVNCRRLVNENGVAFAVGECAVDATANANQDEATSDGSVPNAIAFASAPPDYNTPSVVVRCNNCRRDSAVDRGNIAVNDASPEQHLISLSSTSEVLMTTPCHLVADRDCPSSSTATDVLENSKTDEVVNETIGDETISAFLPTDQRSEDATITLENLTTTVCPLIDSSSSTVIEVDHQPTIVVSDEAIENEAILAISTTIPSSNLFINASEIPTTSPCHIMSYNDRDRSSMAIEIAEQTAVEVACNAMAINTLLELSTPDVSMNTSDTLGQEDITGLGINEHPTIEVVCKAVGDEPFPNNVHSVVADLKTIVVDAIDCDNRSSHSKMSETQENAGNILQSNETLSG